MPADAHGPSSPAFGIRVKEILPDGHRNLSHDVLRYIESMAERHGFTVLDTPIIEGSAHRIRINYERLSDPVFTAVLEHSG
jgi:hypothetical protein